MAKIALSEAHLADIDNAMTTAMNYRHLYNLNEGQCEPEALIESIEAIAGE